MVLDQSVICPVVIGRERDLQSLERLMARAQQGQGQIALISGEAGIGKSRLVKEVKGRFLAESRVLEGFCFQTETTQPYAPLLDLFRNCFAGPLDDETASLLRTALAPVAYLLPELVADFREPTLISSADPKQEKQRIFQVLLRAITVLAQTTPLVIVIEDLHWSDSTSLEFLLQVSRRITALPVLLLLTFRADETTPELTHFLAELERNRLSTELPLTRLSAAQVDAMLRATFALQEPISQEFLDVIFPLTEGNPFFIEEILKALIAEGDIFYADGTWDRKAMDQLRIPRTIQDAVGRRTQKLEEQTLQALTLAAVIGRRFNVRLLQELLGSAEGELTAMLKQLMLAQLVVEETADQFAFRHALTREAIYSTLLLRERQGLHRRVAETLERLYGQAGSAHLADLSYHFYTGELWQKALAYSHQAGDRACALFAQREAVVYYSRALVAARQLQQVSGPGLLAARGQAYEVLGDFNSALDDFEQGLQIAREQQNGSAEWEILIKLGFLWAGRNYHRTGEYFRQAAELAQTLNLPALYAQSLNRLGNWLVNIGQTAEGLTAHHRALEIFERGQDAQGMADTRDLLGMAYLHHGDQVGSYQEYQQAIALLRGMSDKRGLISALIAASSVPYWDETEPVPLPAVVESHAMALEALDLARQIGWSAGHSFSEWALALSLANRGHFGEALLHAQEGLRIATEIEHRQWITGARFVLGHTYLLMLQADRAIPYLEEGLTLARELGSAWWLGNITTDLAQAYVLNQQTDRARTLLDLVTVPADDPLTMVERRMLWARGSLLLAEDQPAAALSIAERLLVALPGEQPPQPIPVLLKLRAEARLALGQLEQAAHDLEQAQVGARLRAALPLTWQIHCLSGQVFREQDRAELAGQEFARARQALQELVNQIADEPLREAFRQSAGRYLPVEKVLSERQRAAEKYGGLTPRERDVARHLALGRSNREIAELLVLSERTVENHVGHILMKLGFDSRAQVAIWAVEKGLGDKN